MMTEKIENMLLAHEDGVYRFSTRPDCDALVSEVFAALREARAENAELRKSIDQALEQLDYMAKPRPFLFSAREYY